MSDVKLTMELDASQVAPAAAAAEAKITAVQELAKFDVGDVHAARVERRMERGLDSFVKSIADAKGPITAITGVVSGLSRAFLISGPLFLAAGIGSAIYEEFSKAQESAEKLHKSFEKLSEGGLGDSSEKMGVFRESVSHLQKQIDEFSKYDEEYQQRGLLDRILNGAAEDGEHRIAESLNNIRKNLIEMTNIRVATDKAQARLLEASDSPVDQGRGRQLLKHDGDSQSIADAQGQLTDATAQQKELEDKLAAQDATLAAARAAAKHAGRRSNAVSTASQGRDELAAAAKTAADKAMALREQIKTTQDAISAEDNQAATATQKQFNEEQARAVKAGLDKQKQLKEEAAEADGQTGAEKAAILRKQVEADKKAAADFVGPKTTAQKIEEENKLLEDQLKLKRLLNENAKEATGIQEQLKEKRPEKELAASDLRTSQADATGFHGQVDSLRREGFAGRVGPNQNHEQLKALAEHTKHLAKIEAEITQLNAKLAAAS